MVGDSNESRDDGIEGGVPLTEYPSVGWGVLSLAEFRFEVAGVDGTGTETCGGGVVERDSCRRGALATLAILAIEVDGLRGLVERCSNEGPR